MKAKFIKDKEDELFTFEECLEKDGVYKHQSEYVGNENLVVISCGTFPVYFGLYDDGKVFSHCDDRGSDKIYKRLGSIDLTVKLVED